MAKIKISELATELGCEGKALLSFLQEKGIEAKRSNSSIDDNEAEIARNHFGKKNASSNANKDAQPAKTDAPAKGNADQGAAGDAPKKKKKIVFLHGEKII